MKRRKRSKSAKCFDWRQTLTGAIVDLLVGTLLLIIAKITE